jgi:hypothetical protein
VRPPLEIGLGKGSPVILSEDGDDGALHLPPPALDSRPGTRAPDVWARRAAARGAKAPSGGGCADGDDGERRSAAGTR